MTRGIRSAPRWPLEMLTTTTLAEREENDPDDRMGTA